MKWLVAIVLIWVVINFIGPHFDDYCIRGKLSFEQARYLTFESEWEAGGPEALPDDRVLRRECSEFSRRIFRVLW